jgi:predicted lipid-binding transport protein (Tim44 family)
MGTDQGSAGIDRLTARDVLDGIRDQLKEPAADELPLLLKISREVTDLDTRRLTPDTAAAWTARPETGREKLAAVLGRQTGFKTGLLVGFLTGFVLAGLFAGLLAMHWLVVLER